MGRSQESFNKKEVRKRKEKKKKEKEKKRQERKESEKSTLDEMIAYVDEFGNITDTPPDPEDKEEVDPEEIEVSVPKKETAPDPGPNRVGKLTFFNEARGFGFIKDDYSGEDVFVHINNMESDITEGTEVTFEIEQGPKGYSALNVKRKE